MFIHKRQVWLVDLEPSKGIEIQKKRPCLVLCKFSKEHFIVLPITSKTKKETISYQLDKVSFLSALESYVNITQIRVVDVQRFIRKYGELPGNKFNAIKQKTVEVLQLLPQKANAHNVRTL